MNILLTFNSHIKARINWKVWATSFLLFSHQPFLAAAELSGQLEAELRYFFQPQADPAQSDTYPSVAGHLDFHHDWDNGNQRIAANLFSRVDSDAERTHTDIRELYWRKTFNTIDLDLYVGFRKVFWGVAESEHLVNIINQTDFVENIDGEQKLGQPMIQATLEKDSGMYSLFVMPYFRERTFPGDTGRLRTTPKIHENDAQYESAAKQHHVDIALRSSHIIGDVDLGIAYFDGTDRVPQTVLVPGPTTSLSSTVAGAILAPRYNQLKQLSIDAQYTKGPWLYKLEALNRDNYNGSSQAMVSGVEYTLYSVLDSDTNIGIVAEYQYDNQRTSIIESIDFNLPAVLKQFDRRYASSVANNDLVVGARFSLNDTQDTNILALATYDDSNHSKFYSIEASRRLSSRWSAEFQARIFSDSELTDPAYFFRDDDYIDLKLIRYFD